MRKLKFNKILKTLAIIIVSLAFFHYLKLLAPLEDLLLRGMAPVASRLHDFGISWQGQFENKQKQADLTAQVTDLRKKIDELTAANANLQEAASENQKLRAYFQLFQTLQLKPKLAHVIFQENYFDASRNNQDLLIDRGSSDGLVPGLAVINESGILVGKILEVKDTTASICLLTSNNCKFAAAIQDQSRTIGITEGNLGLAIKVDFVPLTEKVSQDDLVVTSGLEKSVPAGLVIGRVNQINNNPNDIWQDITLKSSVNFDNLGIVAVLLP